MKITYHIKQITSALSVIGLVVLLVFSPCKVRNSFQDIFEFPTTEVSNKSLSSLKNRVCDVSVDAEAIISKSYNNLQVSQAVLSKITIFNTSTIAVSQKPVLQSYNARGEIPPLAPYYILYQNNKAYL
ncbi:hypothetical protein [Winogradskyella wichelsiae]|uniref:hypothetical protein n=1 Tax=Winogradskyella wichelsiae TaxID=2697007 RepID=UPI0015CE48CA|nr:hypothetical protein [Winogradskyella wichelsiae]